MMITMMTVMTMLMMRWCTIYIGHDYGDYCDDCGDDEVEYHLQ